MTASEDKARIKWHCRRGMLELDLILEQFIHSGLDNLNNKQLSCLELLLSHSDPELYAWFMGHEQPNDVELLEIVTIIRAHT